MYFTCDFSFYLSSHSLNGIESTMIDPKTLFLAISSITQSRKFLNKKGLALTMVEALREFSEEENGLDDSGSKAGYEYVEENFYRSASKQTVEKYDEPDQHL
ncbi:hypothetical protein Trydic_g19892 [Trypoxylus dichotomus]